MTDKRPRRRLAALAAAAALAMTVSFAPPASDHPTPDAGERLLSGGSPSPASDVADAGDSNGEPDRQAREDAPDGHGAAAHSQAAAPFDPASPALAAADLLRSQLAGGEGRQGAPQQDRGAVRDAAPPVAPAGQDVPGDAAGITGPCTASWYGEELRGATTASGVPFDPDRLTVASWHHPFGTVLEVTGPTGDQVLVEVTDRGPAHRLGRCLDLSAAAFREIADPTTGLTEVTYREHS